MKKRLGFLLACILAVGLLVIPAHAANTVSSELTVTLDEATGKPLLTWTSASQYELSFYLYRSTSGGSTNGIINKPFTEVEAQRVVEHGLVGIVGKQDPRFRLAHAEKVGLGG